MRYPRIVEGFTVRHTGGKGYGLFAARAYRKGEPLVRVTGVRIKDTDPRLSHRAVQIAPRLFVEPRRYSAIWYLNHSCAPSAYMDHDCLYARRPIKAGEEITADYSLFTDFASWDMDCACAESGCRRVIVPYRALPVTLKRGRFVSRYLRS